ncbi:hypothetical protein P7K49_004892 [Saguinus oedipus]|uniref:Uncharacterized protein n=1 Tax=Saguinus oedipus TaxID=9490 RepID=A0ABQ9W9A1_SAGOE|nr:hypothetical protein P7K49_004892 [Saguinus oedipus]
MLSQNQRGEKLLWKGLLELNLDTRSQALALHKEQKEGETERGDHLSILQSPGLAYIHKLLSTGGPRKISESTMGIALMSINCGTGQNLQEK